MRFNVPKSWSNQHGSYRDPEKEGGILKLGVVPRNPDGVSFEKFRLQDASFLLSRVDINEMPPGKRELASNVMFSCGIKDELGDDGRGTVVKTPCSVKLALLKKK
jgi:hypothetical protein